jgi:hypothetical protein
MIDHFMRPKEEEFGVKGLRRLCRGRWETSRKIAQSLRLGKEDQCWKLGMKGEGAWDNGA